MERRGVGRLEDLISREAQRADTNLVHLGPQKAEQNAGCKGQGGNPTPLDLPPRSVRQGLCVGYTRPCLCPVLLPAFVLKTHALK